SFYNFQMELQRLKVSRQYYYQLFDEFACNQELIKFVKSEISKLQLSNLQISDLIIGQYYSLLLEREKAELHFNNVLEGESTIVDTLRFKQGLSTYKSM